MNLRIEPRKLAGRVMAQPSKSHAQRLLICAALSEGVSRIANLAFSDDIRAALAAIETLGLARSVKLEGTTAIVRGGGTARGSADCNESGTVLRLLLPLGWNGDSVVFRGKPGLFARPMGIYESLVRERGGRWEQGGDFVRVQYALRAGRFAVPGDVSSQFISGLMLALPMMDDQSIIELTSPLESTQYALMTRQVQRLFGVESDVENERIRIAGRQSYHAADAVAEGDWSHAAFFIALGLLGSEVRIAGLCDESIQPDKAMLEIVRRMGGEVEWRDGAVVTRPSGLRGTRIDASQCPDLVPVLAALACGATGETRIENAARLRYKESDRLRAMATELRALDADVRELPDGLVIGGTGRLKGGAADCHNDHRVAMALSVAACICDEPVTLRGAGCVRKSAPQYWQEYESLGGLTSESMGE